MKKQGKEVAQQSSEKAEELTRKLKIAEVEKNKLAGKLDDVQTEIKQVETREKEKKGELNQH